MRLSLAGSPDQAGAEVRDTALGVLCDHGIDLDFSVVEIGALPIQVAPEPFYLLLDVFPRSRIHAFELDPVLCERLNAKATAGVRYYPVALAGSTGRRRLYETAHQVGTSLYEPQPFWSDTFHDLDAMRLKSTSEIDVCTLDDFARDHALTRIDLMKMDVQGAELEILQGGAQATAEMVAIVTEVEFVPLYKEQPLFSDVDRHLRERGFMLHKLLGVGGRAAKPLMAGKRADTPVQFLWADALYVRNLMDAERLTDEALYRLAVIFDLYDSPDMAHWAFQQVDHRRGTQLAAAFAKQIAG
jgi:FkbM family methyltransferase